MAAQQLYKLFESATNSSADIPSKYYVRVDSTFQTQLVYADIHSVTVSEKFGNACPVMTLLFNDHVGALQNIQFISPEIPYNLYLGMNLETAKGPLPFMLSGQTAVSERAGEMSNMETEVSFMGQGWIDLLNNTPSRSWNNVLISDVVKTIATECGFTNLDIETTDQRMNIIQPRWSDYTLLGWLATHARSATGNVGYEMVTRMDGSFSFKSYNQYLNQSPVKTLYGRGSGATNQNIFHQTLKTNFIQNMNDYGGFGNHSVYFDYANRKFVTADNLPTAVKQSQLSDWMTLPTTLVEPAKVIYGALDTNTAIVSEYMLSLAQNNVFRLSFSMLGDATLQAGDVVNILFNTNENFATPMCEFYSGYWLITQVVHAIDFKTTTFTSHLECTRAGFNGAEVSNMAKSAAGKKLVALPAGL